MGGGEEARKQEERKRGHKTDDNKHAKRGKGEESLNEDNGWFACLLGRPRPSTHAGHFREGIGPQLLLLGKLIEAGE